VAQDACFLARLLAF